jgi:hypothetical protein
MTDEFSYEERERTGRNAGLAIPPRDQPSPSRRAGLRAEIAKTIHRYDNHHALSGNDIPSKHHYGEADAVLALLYREWPWLRAEAEDAEPAEPFADRPFRTHRQTDTKEN